MVVELRPAEAAPATRPPAGVSRRTDLRALAIITVVTAFTAMVPVLRNRIFYYWDDSAALFLPTWRLFGEALKTGQIPLLRDDMWLAGDWIGEAQLGLFNPVVWVNALMTAYVPDLAVSAILIKTEFLVILATGVYLLAREYGARPVPSIALAVALPFSGYTLYWDAANWLASLIGFAMLPHVWWTLRRFARGRLHPLVPIAMVFLGITSGSPYGALGVVVVLVAVVAERLVLRDRSSLVRLGVIGLAAGGFAALVFLPLLGIRAVGFRGGSGVTNDNVLVPGLGQLLNLSAPSYVAPLKSFASPSSTPITYLAWFVAPMLPWLRWSVLRAWRPLAGIFVFGGIFLAFALGPSNLWLFRWPARLIEYVFLAVCVVFALLLSAVPRIELSRPRLLASGAIVLVGTYFAWAAAPTVPGRHLVALLVTGALVAALLWVWANRPRLTAAVMVLGTVLVLGLQVIWVPANLTLTGWNYPHNVAQLHTTWADRADGNTFTVGSAYAMPYSVKNQKAMWRETVFSNIGHAGGLKNLNSYSGMGNLAFQNALCMDALGMVCPEAYERIFTPDPSTGVPLADLFRLTSVVVVDDYVPDGWAPPAGWTVSGHGTYTTTLRRVQPLPATDARVSWAAPTVTVTDDRRLDGRHEQFRYQGGGRVILSTLAWPGWRATVGGQEIPVTLGPAGLVQLDLPQRSDAATVELSFWPSGLSLGLVGLVFGLLLAVGLTVADAVTRRRPRPGPLAGADA